MGAESHRVQPGDSLASLSQSYYGNSKHAKFLQESNPDIKDPGRLTVGTVVKIPPIPDETSATASKPGGAANPERASGGRTYKVQAGDSFYSIAKAVLGNANRWKELYAINKESVNGDATNLQIGQVLRLPEP